jgi:DEAD/DEAH box helicase domain-containing protein
LVADAIPLDQVFVKNPDSLFGSPLERAVIDPCNPAVLGAHVSCAAFEEPISLSIDAYWFSSRITDLITGGTGTKLIQEGQVYRFPFNSMPAPALGLSLRNVEQERFLVVDGGEGDTILEELEASRALFTV